jgi:hypothetical protein
VKGAPGSLLGGRLGAVAPPASFNVQEVPSKKRCAATPLRVRVMGGGGGWFWGRGGDGWFLRGMVFAGGRVCEGDSL